MYYLEADPDVDELVRLDGPPTNDMPSGTAFEDLWLELLTERQADTARGSGSLIADRRTRDRCRTGQRGQHLAGGGARSGATLHRGERYT